MANLDLDIQLALRAYTLAVALSADAETVAIAGPSGAGKTTILRAVAGLRRPDAGHVAMAGSVWFDAGSGVDVAPERRAVGYVPQDHGLFPHMTVRANVAFGATSPIDELLRKLHIDQLAYERPAALSGGERQRVALARALAREPAVLLLDEPLAALDAHTRELVRDELAEILSGLGVPTLVVTHDFRDAAALAERVAILVDGTLRQMGTAAELTVAPADAFVVSFTGGSVIEGHARPRAGGGADITLNAGGVLRSSQTADGPVAVGVYPWEVSVGPAVGHAIDRTVTALAREGARTRVRLGELAAECASSQADALALRPGMRVTAKIAPEHVRLFVI